jgi:hypothetical protein
LAIEKSADQKKGTKLVYKNADHVVQQKHELGGADGIRTHDLLDAIEARSQLRHGPTDANHPMLTSARPLRPCKLSAPVLSWNSPPAHIFVELQNPYHDCVSQIPQSVGHPTKFVCSCASGKYPIKTEHCKEHRPRQARWLIFQSDSIRFRFRGEIREEEARFGA